MITHIYHWLCNTMFGWGPLLDVSLSSSVGILSSSMLITSDNFRLKIELLSLKDKPTKCRKRTNLWKVIGCDHVTLTVLCVLDGIMWPWSAITWRLRYAEDGVNSFIVFIFIKLSEFKNRQNSFKSGMHSLWSHYAMIVHIGTLLWPVIFILLFSTARS